MVQLKRTNSSNPDFKSLIHELDLDLNNRYGDIQNLYDKHNIIVSNNTVLIAYINEIPVGCGCFKEFDSETIEIKRMFVKDEYRGRGIATRILKELEDWAKEKGFQAAILETGIKQFESISLYEKSGYKRIDNFGQYVGNINSVCMKKNLGRPK